MEFDRLNSPNTSTITLEVLGHQLQFSQDPNSKHLGTTVWDASMVFVKFLEKNSRKGRFCSSKLKGKRVIELGAGCGVAGFGMALLGCDVVSTDQVEVAELDWGNQGHIKAVGPPFDYIIGTDVIYAEHLLEPLLQTIFALSGPKTTIMLGYEIRSTSVHEQMLCMWKNSFEVKTIPKSKMDIKYQHDSIQLYIMEQKGTRSALSQKQGHDQSKNEVEITEKHENDEEDESSEKLPAGLKGDKLSDWEARRYGSMAARLLRDVKIT